MTSIRGTVQNGQVVLDEPGALADGTRVEVVPDNRSGAQNDDGPMTEDEIRAVLEAMERIKPEGWLSPEEFAAWRASLQTQKEDDKSRFFEHAEKLRRIFE